jgi:hypothetical protein
MRFSDINEQMWIELTVGTSSIAAWMMILIAALVIHHRTKLFPVAALWVRRCK